MKYKMLFIIILLLAYSCENKQVKHKFFLEERPLVKKIIRKYEKSLSLKPLDIGVSNFEIRIWTKVVNDSFPVFLQRCYFENGIFRGDYFCFHTQNHFLIERINQLDSIVAEKIEIGIFENRYLDSAKSQLSIFNIKDFDTKIFAEANIRRMFTGKISMILLEQATSNRYKYAFIPNPIPYNDEHPSILAYANFCTFISDSLYMSNPNCIKWHDEQLAKIINSGYYKPADSVMGSPK
jgi:hypothetical protein